MRVLVACEESQRVTAAFRKRGHEAYSCDLLPASGEYPEFHFRDDVKYILPYAWDMVIAFPPCTHLAVSGARWFKEKQADGRQQEAIQFFLQFTNLTHVRKVAIENPISIMSTLYRRPDQIIQPWMFGEDASKATCLWLKGLPPLWPTKFVPATYLGRHKKVYANQTPSGQNKLGPSPTRAMKRSQTYKGIAEAMAEQWGEV